MRDWRDWSGLSIGAISFGQEVGVTSIQILTAINAIANGGYRVRPSIVDRIIDENGDLVFARTPERTRLTTPRTAAAVSEAFEGVVLRGTGKRAALEGYRAAGKTGTAQKIVNGQYSDSKYVSSFIGFAPLPNPKITVLVQIDEPKGSHYGGDVSAPFFQKIAQETLMQLKIPPDQSLPLPKITPLTVNAGSEDYLPNATPVQPIQSVDKTQPVIESQEVISVQVGGEYVVLPDFRGMAKRNVLDKCTELSIRLQSNGSGVAVYQWPLPGSRIQVGAACSVTFAKKHVNNSFPMTSAILTPQNTVMPVPVSARQ